MDRRTDDQLLEGSEQSLCGEVRQEQGGGEEENVHLEKVYIEHEDGKSVNLKS